MEFQVVTDKQMRDLQAGRSKIAFYFKKDISSVTSAIEDRKTDTGKMKLSSVELTFLDLLRYPQATGGLDNILTILAELGPKLDPDKMATLGEAFDRSIFQRAGYLLNRAGLAEGAKKLRAFMERGPQPQWVELDPSLRSDPDLAPQVVSRDEQWHVLIRRLAERDVEPDRRTRFDHKKRA